MGKLTTLVLLALSLGMTARAQLIVGGGGPCVLSGSQTSGYVLTATDGAQGCSWQTAGGASVDANTIKNAVYCPDTSGSANTITCAPTTTFPSSYAAGQAVWVLVANSNSGAATINVKSLGAKAVTKNGATALASGNLIANHAYLMMYDGTQFQVLTYTPLATDIPTLAPLASPTFTGTVSGITATMVGLGSVTNDAQTKAAIVPNTAPSAGQMLVANAGGTAYAPVTMSGSCTMASTGAISCSGSGASTTLNNLGTTSINAALLFQTGLSLGSASAPPQNLFFYGSGTYGSGSMEITAATGTTAYTAIVPTTNASDTFAMLGVGNAFTAQNSIKSLGTTPSSANVALNILDSAGTKIFQFGPSAAGQGSIWPGNVTPSTSNYALRLDTDTAFGSAGNFYWVEGGNIRMTLTSSKLSIGSGDGSGFDVNTPSGLLVKYNNIGTVSNGIPAEYATVDLSAQSAAVTATALYTPAATGLFRVSYTAKVTTAGTTSILGGTTGLVLAYTDGGDSVAQTAFTCPADDQTGTALAIGTGNTTNTTQANVNGSCIIYAKTGVGITYAYGYTSTGTAMQYELHIKLEAM